MYRAPLDDNLKSALSFDAHAVCLSFGKKNIYQQNSFNNNQRITKNTKRRIKRKKEKTIKKTYILINFIFCFKRSKFHQPCIVYIVVVVFFFCKKKETRNKRSTILFDPIIIIINKVRFNNSKI